MEKATFSGSPYLGVFLRVTDRLALVPPSCPGALMYRLAQVLGVRVVRTSLADSDVVGSLIAMNSRSILVSDTLDPTPLESLPDGIEIHTLHSRLNALGNTILANDQGALVHPDYSPAQREVIERALGVPVRPGTVAGLGTVSKAAVATSRGVAVHPRATNAEIENLEAVLQVPAHRSTANFGVPLVGACVVANARGILVGDLTTPVEIVHLQEALKVLD